MTCPVTVAYLREMRGGLSVSALYGDVIEQLEELIQRAEVVDGCPMHQRLRCFFIVEMLQSVFLKKLLNRHALFLDGRGIIKETFLDDVTKPLPRSRDGLDQVLKMVDNIDGEVAINLTEIAFAKSSQKVTADVLVEDRYNTVFVLLTVCTKAVKVLRKELKNKEEVNLGQVGRLLAEAAHLTKSPYSDIVNYGLTLLRISPNNPETPWQTTSEFQE